jgi:hypothetical protein
MPVFFSNSYGRHQHEARSGVWLMRGIALAQRLPFKARLRNET